MNIKEIWCRTDVDPIVVAVAARLKEGRILKRKEEYEVDTMTEELHRKMDSLDQLETHIKALSEFLIKEGWEV